MQKLTIAQTTCTVAATRKFARGADEDRRLLAKGQRLHGGIGVGTRFLALFGNKKAKQEITAHQKGFFAFRLTRQTVTSVFMSMKSIAWKAGAGVRADGDRKRAERMLEDGRLRSKAAPALNTLANNLRVSPPSEWSADRLTELVQLRSDFLKGGMTGIKAAALALLTEELCIRNDEKEGGIPLSRGERITLAKDVSNTFSHVAVTCDSDALAELKKTFNKQAATLLEAACKSAQGAQYTVGGRPSGAARA